MQILYAVSCEGTSECCDCAGPGEHCPHSDPRGIVRKTCIGMRSAVLIVKGGVSTVRKLILGAK
jgi:hypothetical protein